MYSPTINSISGPNHKNYPHYFVKQDVSLYWDIRVFVENLFDFPRHKKLSGNIYSHFTLSNKNELSVYFYTINVPFLVPFRRKYSFKKKGPVKLKTFKSLTKRIQLNLYLNLNFSKFSNYLKLQQRFSYYQNNKFIIKGYLKQKPMVTKKPRVQFFYRKNYYKNIRKVTLAKGSLP